MPMHAHWSCFSPDGKIVAATTLKKIVFWDVQKKTIQKEFVGHEGLVTHCGFSSDGKRLISVDNSTFNLHLWDIATKKLLLVLKGHKAPVSACFFSHDQTKIISASHDRTIKIWDSQPPR